MPNVMTVWFTITARSFSVITIDGTYEWPCQLNRFVRNWAAHFLAQGLYTGKPHDTLRNLRPTGRSRTARTFGTLQGWTMRADRKDFVGWPEET